MKPKLRFKEFNSDWNTYKFYELVTIKNGQVDPNDEQYRNLPHIGPGNIEKETGRLLEYNLAKDDKLVSSKYLFDKESVIYGKINPHFAKVCYPKFVGLCSADAYPINPIKDKLTSEFLLYLLLNPQFTKFATSVSMRTGMPKINRDELSIYKFTIPEIAEQNKIGNMLTLLDKKIELQTKKIEDLKLFKKGLNYKIFSNCKYEYTLKDILIEYNKRTKVNNEYEVLSSTANGIYLQSEYFNKQAASNDTTGYKIIPRGYITYRSMSDTGEFHFNVQNIVNYGIVSPAYPVFNIDETKVNKNYLIYYMNENKNFINTILSTKEGGTRFALSYSKLLSIKIKIPSREEQDQFASLISDINKKIDLEQLKLDNINSLKKGLMQNMFV